MFLINLSGRRFRFGAIAGRKVILVMTGLAMVYKIKPKITFSISPGKIKANNQIKVGLFNMVLQVNAGITTQLLLSLFNVKGVVHYGIAGNANPSFNVGDVTIPQYWAHLGLWNWQVKKSVNK